MRDEQKREREEQGRRAYTVKSDLSRRDDGTHRKKKSGFFFPLKRARGAHIKRHDGFYLSIIYIIYSRIIRIYIYIISRCAGYFEPANKSTGLGTTHDDGF